MNRLCSLFTHKKARSCCPRDFVRVRQVKTVEGFETELPFASIEKVVANILNQRQIGCIRSEHVPQHAISPSMGALLALTNEIRTHKTSA